MNPNDQQAWRESVLRTFAAAVGASPVLRHWFVFKGAQILARHVPAHARASLDLDAALRGASDWTQQRLEREITNALQAYLADAEIKPFALEQIVANPSPKRGHPRGWNGWQIEIKTRAIDRTVRRVATASVDLAAPEPLRAGATCELRFAGETVVAYSLQRVLGEKGRAFLQSIAPDAKRVRRTKDLFDLALTLRERPLATDEPLWREAGLHFFDACLSRDVDFVGIESFARGFDETRQRYEEDPTLREIPFDDAWAAVEAIVAIWTDVQRTYVRLSSEPDDGTTALG